MSAVVIAKGLREMQRFFDELPEVAEQAAVYAINDTVQREGLTAIKRDMRDQVEFPPGYLEGDRLKPVRFATRDRLEAVIRGRDRPTSLARFAQGQTPELTGGGGRAVRMRTKDGLGSPGVRVRVQPGKTEHLKRAFLIKLKNGNIGLAVRVKNGESLRKSTAAVEMVASKFLRQFGRLSRA